MVVGVHLRVARAAAFGVEPEVGDLPPHVSRAVREVSGLLSWSGGVCPLCSRRFSTRRGYYMHLVMSHEGDISSLVDRIAERVAGGRRF